MAQVVYEGIDEQPGQQTKCYFQVHSTAELIGTFQVPTNRIKRIIEKRIACCTDLPVRIPLASDWSLSYH